MTKKSENVEAETSLTEKIANAMHVLDTPFCLEKTAHVLDEVMQMARDLKNPEAALEVANGWLTLAQLLDPEQDSDEDGPKHKTGFHHE